VGFQRRLGNLPITTYQAGERVLVSGSRTERLLILKKGAVAIIKDNVEIAKVAKAGTVFGELSVLLDQPHTADACALEPSEFYIADATALTGRDPVVLLSRGHFRSLSGRRRQCSAASHCMASMHGKCCWKTVGATTASAMAGPLMIRATGDTIAPVLRQFFLKDNEPRFWRQPPVYTA